MVDSVIINLGLHVSDHGNDHDDYEVADDYSPLKNVTCEECECVCERERERESVRGRFCNKNLFLVLQKFHVKPVTSVLEKKKQIKISGQKSSYGIKKS